MIQTDILIIGAGPAGYEVALAAAKAGLVTYLIEKENVGGVCLNKGCIPTKTYITNKEKLGDNLDQVIATSKSNIQSLSYGMHYSLKKAGVNLILGEASVTDGSVVRVETTEETVVISPKHLVIATGSASKPFTPAEGQTQFTLQQLFDGQVEEEEISIIGGGAVGIEAAVIANAMGKQVTVVEQEEEILKGMDCELAEILRDILEEEGIEFLLDSDKAETQAIIPCCGRKAILPTQFTKEELRLNPNGSIWVDEFMNTSIPGIYAIGDCNGIRMEANVAKIQAGILVENLLHHGRKNFDASYIAKCVFTPVEFVSVGLCQQDITNEAMYKVYYANVAVTGAGVIHNQDYSVIKVIADAQSDIVKGIHILASYASEMAAFASLAMKKQVTVKELKEIGYLHPTLSEAFADLNDNI